MAKDSAKNSVKPVSSYEVENTGGILSGFLADEDDFDRRSLLRLGTWGAASVGAVIVAVLANQSSIGMRREQVAALDLARQSMQIQSVAKESQNETRRLASAIDTLNGDRDRLYSRVSVVEQGLEAVTGSIARQNTAAATPAAASAAPPPSTTAELPAVPQNPPPPVIAPVKTTMAAVADKPKPDGKPAEPAPATVASIAPGAPNNASVSPPAANPPAATPAPFMASKSMMAPPDAAASKLIEPAAPAKAAAAAPDVVASVTAKDSMPKDGMAKDAVVKNGLAKDSPTKDSLTKDSPAKDIPAKDIAAPDAAPTPPSAVAVQRTEFAVDVGGANSVGGLRALWRGLLKSKSNAPLAALHPIIVVKESNTGMGMQLRLVAGPLGDAAAAAKICAAMIENDRSCETTVFDGQRLAMKTEDPEASSKSGLGKPGLEKPDGDKSSSDKSASDKPSSDKSGSDKSAAVDPDAVKHTADNPVLMRPGSGKQLYSYRRHSTRRVTSEDPPAKKPESTSSTISSFFSRRTN